MSDIQKFSVVDSRIVQQAPKYAVEKGALSVASNPFNAIASTSSQMSFNIQSPSLNVFLQREMEWTAGCNMRCNVEVDGLDDTAPLPPANQGNAVLVFGRDVALSAFPLQQSCSTLTATINDCVSTINTSDVLNEVLRLTDSKANRLQRTCPTMLDKYVSYNDCIDAVNNPLGSYTDSTDYDNVPNGAYFDIVFTDQNGVQLVGNGTYNDGTGDVSYVNGVPVLGNTATGNARTTYPIYYRYTTTEKLVLSPFIFSEQCGDEVGLYGVQNIQLVMNFSNASRSLRNASEADGNNRIVSGVQFASNSPWVNPRLNVLFLTPSLGLRLPPKSIVPYFEYPRYISTPNTQVQPGQSLTLQSQTITLSQIPDMLLIYAKPQSYDITEGDYYLPIDQISLNFDNFSGLLSSHTKQQLYNISHDNGLMLDYNAWNGQGRGVLDAPAVPLSSSNAGNVNLVGGFLLLKMGKDVPLQASQAPGLVGNYTLQYNVRVNNRTDAVQTPILYTMAINSGFFETQSGSSRILKGVLNETDVIDAPMAGMTRGDLRRIVGGSFFSKLGNALGKVKDFMLRPEVRAVVKTVGRMHPATAKAVDVAESLGYGMSGGKSTGGRSTGGRRKKPSLDDLMQ